MNELLKRLKSATWIAFAGLVVAIIGLVLENLSAFNLTEVQATFAMIIGTSIISQITKYLNSDKK